MTHRSHQPASRQGGCHHRVREVVELRGGWIRERWTRALLAVRACEDVGMDEGGRTAHFATRRLPSHRRALRSLLVAIPLGAILGGAGFVAASLATTSTHPGVRVMSAGSAGNKRGAEATAKGLLEEVPLPAGEREVSTDESVGSVLGGAERTYTTWQLVELHRFWRSAENPAQAIVWIEAHAPAGSKVTAHGTSSRLDGPAPPRSLPPSRIRRYLEEHSITTSWSVVFSFPAVPGELSTVTLSVIVAPARGGGDAVRANAEVVWTQPRPAAEHIPAAAKVLTVKARDRRRHISFTSQITRPSKVRAISALIEGLQRPPSGGVCAGGALANGKEPEPVVDLAFREARDGPPLARVRIDENTGCGGSISFWSDGREQDHLEGAVEATHALHKILNRTL